jgi:hypothetical protein
MQLPSRLKLLTLAATLGNTTFLPKACNPCNYVTYLDPGVKTTTASSEYNSFPVYPHCTRNSGFPLSFATDTILISMLQLHYFSFGLPL